MLIDDYLFRDTIEDDDHIIATYVVKSRDFLKAVRGIAIGQSVGNPEVRSERDTEKIMRDHLAKILDVQEALTGKTEGAVRIAYPLVNFDVAEDGIMQLLCALMGGQMDIDVVESCRLVDVRFPEDFLAFFKGPKFGMSNIRQRAKAEDRPLLGAIVKPKTGLSVADLLAMVKELLAGGVDFIKEDEILGNPACCPFKERVKLVARMVNEFAANEGREIFYTPCINADYPYFLDRARYAADQGAKAVHLNVWAGLSAYRALRELDMPDTAIFFQKSGDKVLTSQHHRFAIDWPVMVQLARMIGADFIHAGMWQGYLSDSEEFLGKVLDNLRGESRYAATVPSLSCGSHPGLVNTTVRTFGTGVMMNVGGAIHGHPMGTTAGARAMRQSFECTQQEADIKEFMQDKPELKAAIEKWGYVE